MTHAGIPAGPVWSDRARPVPVRKKPYRLQLWLSASENRSNGCIQKGII